MTNIKTSLQALLLHADADVRDTIASSVAERCVVHVVESNDDFLSRLSDGDIDIAICGQVLASGSGETLLESVLQVAPESIVVLLVDGETAEPQATFADAGGRRLAITVEEFQQQLPDILQRIGATSAAPDGTKAVTAVTPAEEERSSVEEETATAAVSDADSLSEADPGVPEIVDLADVGVIVYSEDEALCASIEELVGGSYTVRTARTIDETSQYLQQGGQGVLVTDVAVADKDVVALTGTLRKAEPRLVVVVAGQRDDGEQLMNLINAGTIFRFLIKPVTAGSARLAIQASAKRYLELRKEPVQETIDPAATSSNTTDERTGEKPAGLRLAPLLGIAAVILVAVLLTVLLGSDDDVADPDIAQHSTVALPDGEVPKKDVRLETEAQSPAPESEAIAANGGDAVVGEVNEIRQQALAALNAGRISSTDGQAGALSLYKQALAITPSASDLRAEFDRAIGVAIKQIEADLLAGNLETASGLLADVRKAKPFESRLAALEEQLNRERRAALVAESTAMAASGDLAGALLLLDKAQGLDESIAPEVSAAREQLLANQKTNEINELLTKAGKRLREGKLIAPQNDSARDYYQAVLDLEPENQAAAQGLDLIAGNLTRDARRAIAADDLTQAAQWLDAAEATGAASDVTDALREQIAARRAEVARREQQEAERNKLAAEEAARKAAAAAAAKQQAKAAATAPASPAPQEGAADGQVATNNVDQQQRVDASQLVRTRYQPPEYPSSALRRNRDGWVVLDFTITRDGSVEDIEIVESEPGTLFDRAARRALSRWEYKPIVVGGAAVERRARVRIQFALD